jgi:hypothetical protein
VSDSGQPSRGISAAERQYMPQLDSLRFFVALGVLIIHKVGSPIRSLLEFAHIIRLARTTDEWSQALNDSLAPAACSVAQVDARRSIARQHDWDRLVRLIAHTLCDRLGPEYLERFEQIPFRDQA